MTKIAHSQAGIFKEGLEQGSGIKIMIAERMLLDGMDHARVVELTQLPLNIVLALKKKHMSEIEILKNTTNYHDDLIESLKNPKEADLYLRIAMEEYHEDYDIESLLVALRNIAEARRGMS